MNAVDGKSARRRAIWLTGFFAGLAMAALAAVWLNGSGQPSLEEGVPTLSVQPLVSAIDSAACRDRAVGAQYAMVCVDSQLLNTDDPTACDRFGGPYQIIVCPDPSQIAMADTRPTIAAGGGSVILPLPPAGTLPPADPADGIGATTPEVGDRSTPALADPGVEEPLSQDDTDSIGATPESPGTSGEVPQPATPLPEPPRLPPTLGPTPELPPANPPGGDQPVPTPGDVTVATPVPAATLPQVEPNPGVVTATATATVTLPAGPDVTPTPAVRASATPAPSPIITLPEEGYVLAGVGQQTTPALELTSTRLLLVRLAYNGAGDVAVSVRGATEYAGRLILQTAGLPEKSGVIDIPSAGIYFIDVSTTSGGSWTLTVSQPTPPLQTPFVSPGLPLTGRGDQATNFVRLRSGVIAIRMEHAAAGNFAVTLYDAELGQQIGAPLTQALAPFQQIVTVPIAREGIYVFDVTATDAWSITIQ